MNKMKIYFTLSIVIYTPITSWLDYDVLYVGLPLKMAQKLQLRILLPVFLTGQVPSDHSLPVLKELGWFLVHFQA